MAEKTLVQGIHDGLRTALGQYEEVVVLGEDVGENGGVFRATEGLWEEFGDERVIDTPLAEAGIVGAAIGMAVDGLRPVAEIQFMGFIYPAFEQIVTHAARLRTRTQGRYPALPGDPGSLRRRDSGSGTSFGLHRIPACSHYRSEGGGPFHSR